MQDFWQYSTAHNSACKVIEEQTLWGRTVCRVWLPNQDAVVRVPRSSLRPLESSQQPERESERIAYVAAAAKVADVLEGSTSSTQSDILLAPMESNVIPLPHQIRALSRAISGDRVRYLLADEVGLGKTIEAGLIIRELKLRGLVKRILVVAPKSLAFQWQAEMQTHFNEQFSLVNANDLEAYERLMPGLSSYDQNPWLEFPQAIVTTDAFKPLNKRRGWSAEAVQHYNLTRFDRLVSAQWDLIVVDEAHRLGGTNEFVARYNFGKGLAEAAPYLLLLSATPHQGKSDAFARLMGLLDPISFPDVDSVSRQRVAPFVIRTEKRQAINAKGEALFRPRTTQTLKVDLEAFPEQLELYNEVTDYARFGYNLAVNNRSHIVALLMILFQRIVSSSTRAIRTTLERRLTKLQSLKDESRSGVELIIEELEDLTGQELLDELLDVNESGRLNEIEQVEFLVSLAFRAESSGPDAKALRLIELIYDLQAQENDDQLKVLIFTEFTGTQAMLNEMLQSRGLPCTLINGSMSMDERRSAQRRFAADARVMISTDAGGEGLNLQFAHVVINYDMPWNPMRMEQRIGRVDRIGQPKIVQAFNFIFENSIESRVLEVIEHKLGVIHLDTGIDKTNDVLNSPVGGDMYERMMTQVVMEKRAVEYEVDMMIEKVNQEIVEAERNSPLTGLSEQIDPSLAESLRVHPLPAWLERMTVNYLRIRGGAARQSRKGWMLSWPDGEVHVNGIFNAQQMDERDEYQLLNLENSRIRGLALNIPQTVAGQLVPVVKVSSLPDSLVGVWGLAEIRLFAGLHRDSSLLRIPSVRHRYFPVFVSDEGKVFPVAARRIWDELVSQDAQVMSSLGSEASGRIFDKVRQLVEGSGAEEFAALTQAHLQSIERESVRGELSFTKRREAIDKVGLPEVKHFRSEKCREEETLWRGELSAAKQIVPDVRLLLVLQIGHSSIPSAEPGVML